MRLATGPYPIDGGKHVTISLPSATLLVRGVIIGNLTPAAVTVTIAGQTSHLLPASANLYTLSSGAQGIVVTSLGTATQSGTITAEWVTPATVPPSGYPFGGAVTNLTLGPDASVKITGPVTLAAGSTVKLTGPITIAGGTLDIGGGQLSKTGVANQPTTAQIPKSYFGGGTAGAVTITGTATLVKAMQYTTLKVTGTLKVAGYLVQAQTAITVSATGKITCSATVNIGAPSGTYYGGAAGATASSTGAHAGAAANGTQPTEGTVGGGAGGSSQTKIATHTETSVGGAAGTVPPELLTASLLGDKGFSGGSSGGATVFNDEASPQTLIATGGGGGGVCVLLAPKVTVASGGRITCRGGDGTVNTPVTPTNGLRAAGGGGGGLVIVGTYSLSAAVTAFTVGGGAGAKGGSSTATLVANPGGTGHVVLIVT